MPLPAYRFSGKIDCDIAPDLSVLKGKSVVITGGADGLGETYVRAFAAAGAHVTFGDINQERGKSIEAELAPNVVYVKCDTRSWDDQLGMFKQAIAKSPAKSCDVVIANAGVSGADPLYALDDPTGEPTKPDLRILDINLTGVLYTTKLALHYFRAQPERHERDRCLIIKGSIAGILDQPGSWLYSTSKWALRGLYRSMRYTTWQEGIRVNYVGPWYTQTSIMSAAVIERLESKGVEFSLPEDCAKAMLRIATDQKINGHSFAVVPRSGCERGFFDTGLDEQEEGSYWDGMQKAVLTAAVRAARSQ